MKNRIHVYTLTYNESHFVKNFLTAYKEAERIVVYDNMSTDNTVELLQQDPRVEIRLYDSDNQIRDDLYLEIKNYSWKESRGLCEWVVIVDFDEIFCRARVIEGKPVFDLDLTEVYKRGFNMIKPCGYNMISLNAPLYTADHPFVHSQRGTYHVPEEKLCCFRPEEISEIRYVTGAHWASPLDKNQDSRGIRMCTDREWKVLHYKFWNLELYMQKIADYQKRLSEWNKKMGAGWHYTQTLQWHEQCFRNGEAIAQYLFDIPKPDSTFKPV
jgi:glycosyltransferase involved in cell wall biosynthesis